MQDAEDALQEILLAAWRGLAGFESRSSLRTWLCAIAKRRLSRHYEAERRAAVIRSGLVAVPDVGADDRSSDVERRDEVTRALGSLPQGVTEADLPLARLQAGAELPTVRTTWRPISMSSRSGRLMAIQGRHVRPSAALRQLLALDGVAG